MSMSSPAGAFGRLALVLGVAAGTGCASTPPLDEATLPGCWRFEDGDAARALGLPWGIELTESPLADAGLEGARVALSVRPGQPRPEPGTLYWRVLESGRVQVGFAVMGPWSLGLDAEGASLSGVARSTGDAAVDGEEPDRSDHPVVAHRVDCSTAYDAG